MIVVDTSALIAIVWMEPEASHYRHILGAADAVLVCAVSLLETSFVLAGRTGASERWQAVDLLIREADMRVIAFDDKLAWLARDAFLRFGKGRHPAALNMGDCASYALATSRGAPLLYKGRDFAQTDIRAAA